jgi:hypothetical protein
MDVEVSPSMPKKPTGISPLEVQTPPRYWNMLAMGMVSISTISSVI